MIRQEEPFRPLRRFAELRLLLLALGALAAGILTGRCAGAVLVRAGVELSSELQLLTAAGCNLLMLVFFLLGVRFLPFFRQSGSWRRELWLRPWKSRRIWLVPGAALGILLAAGGVTTVWQWAGGNFGLSFGEPPNLALLARLALRGKVLFLASAVLLAPVTEELLFRRVLYGVARLWLPVWCATGVSAALFAAVHGSLLQAPGLLLMGAVWQEIDRRTHSLYPSILLHACSNLWVALFFFSRVL